MFQATRDSKVYSWTREFTAGREIKVHFALAGPDGILTASTLGRAGLDVSRNENFLTIAAAREKPPDVPRAVQATPISPR